MYVLRQEMYVLHGLPVAPLLAVMIYALTSFASGVLRHSGHHLVAKQQTARMMQRVRAGGCSGLSSAVFWLLVDTSTSSFTSSTITAGDSQVYAIPVVRKSHIVICILGSIAVVTVHAAHSITLRCLSISTSC